VNTYEIDMGYPVPKRVTDDLWRVQFYAPVPGLGMALCWVDNMPSEAAQRLVHRWRTQPPGRQMWCRLCHAGIGRAARHLEHDQLPEQRGWLYSEITGMRGMPMREAV
jgi:hypothetical protein